MSSAQLCLYRPMISPAHTVPHQAANGLLHRHAGRWRRPTLPRLHVAQATAGTSQPQHLEHHLLPRPQAQTVSHITKRYQMYSVRNQVRAIIHVQWDQEGGLNKLHTRIFSANLRVEALSVTSTSYPLIWTKTAVEMTDCSFTYNVSHWILIQLRSRLWRPFKWRNYPSCYLVQALTLLAR